MLANKDSSISEFTSTLYEMSEDEKIYQQCLARERYERDKLSCVAYGKKQGLEEGLKEGRIEGLKEGRKEGLKEGQNLITTLNLKLLEANRLDDLKRACSDPEYLQLLLKEFNL